MAIAVVYDQGSATPTEIIQSLGDTDDLLVVTSSSEHGRSVRRLFAECSRAVLDIADDGLPETLGRYHVEGIVTYSERMLGATAALAAAMGLPFHSGEVVEMLTDKGAQRRRLREAGVDSVASIELVSMAQWPEAVSRVGLPAVVKPAHGEASRSTVLVHDAEVGGDLVERLLAAEGRLVVEEFLEGVEVEDPYGDYVSVESAVLPAGRAHYAVSGKLRLAPPFRESGQFWPPLVDDETHADVVELADLAIAALGVTVGLVHTEIKLTAAGPRLIEVNGRMAAFQADLARRAANLDMVKVAADIGRGRPVRIDPVQPDRVYFQIFTPGPTALGTLRAVSGIDGVRRLPEVTQYRTLTRPGGAVGGASLGRLDLICGAVDRHALLPALVASVTHGLEYEFDMDGRTVVRSGADLLINE